MIQGGTIHSTAIEICTAFTWIPAVICVWGGQVGYWRNDRLYEWRMIANGTTSSTCPVPPLKTAPPDSFVRRLVPITMPKTWSCSYCFLLVTACCSNFFLLLPIWSKAFVWNVTQSYNSRLIALIDTSLSVDPRLSSSNCDRDEYCQVVSSVLVTIAPLPLQESVCSKSCPVSCCAQAGFLNSLECMYYRRPNALVVHNASTGGATTSAVSTVHNTLIWSEYVPIKISSSSLLPNNGK